MRAPDPNRAPAAVAGWRAGELWLLFGITALAAAVRLFRVELWSVASAEVATFAAVTMPLQDEHGFWASAAGQHPLGYLVLRWLLESGLLPFHGEGWLRLPFVFVGTVSVPLLALAAGLLVPSRTALLAAGLLAVHPWHLAMCQLAAPPVVAVACTLVAVAAALAAQRRWRRSRLAVAVLFVALACACHRSGLGAGLMLVAGAAAVHLPGATGRRRLLAVVALVVSALVPVALHALAVWPYAVVAPPDESLPWWAFVVAPSAPVLLLALLAPWVVRPMPVAAVAAAIVPMLAFGGLALVGGDVTVDDLCIVLVPVLVLAAAVTTAVAGQVLREGAGGATWVGAMTVPAATFVWLLVATVLHATVYAGHRSPWRDAADLALDANTDGRGLVVAARLGSRSLTYYLRPNHWREPEADPHPGVRSERLDGAWGPALTSLFAATAGQQTFVVLRCDEFEALQREAGAEARLRSACTLFRVLPCPRANGDGTLYVFRSRGEG